MWKVPIIVSFEVITFGNFHVGFGRPWEVSFLVESGRFKTWTPERRLAASYLVTTLLERQILPAPDKEAPQQVNMWFHWLIFYQIQPIRFTHWPLRPWKGTSICVKGWVGPNGHTSKRTTIHHSFSIQVTAPSTLSGSANLVVWEVSNLMRSACDTANT